MDTILEMESYHTDKNKQEKTLYSVLKMVDDTDKNLHKSDSGTFRTTVSYVYCSNASYTFYNYGSNNWIRN
jgi:hypothetical protein